MVCRAIWQDIALVGYILAHENMTHLLVQYPAILHFKPLNNIYVLHIIVEKVIS